MNKKLLVSAAVAALALVTAGCSGTYTAPTAPTTVAAGTVSGAAAVTGIKHVIVIFC